MPNKAGNYHGELPEHMESPGHNVTVGKSDDQLGVSVKDGEVKSNFTPRSSDVVRQNQMGKREANGE